MIDFGRTKALAGLLFFAYWYFKTKEKIPMYVVALMSYLVLCTTIFKLLLPNIEFGSPTIEYLCYLAIVGIPFLFIIYKIGIMFDRMTGDQKKDIFRPVFEMSKSNLLFY